jgi:small subunit ribosomal protein S18
MKEEAMPPTKKRTGAAKKERRPKRKVCNFCADKLPDINYKDVTRLRKYISERGKILPRRISGNCARHQRGLTIAVKRARIIAFLPFASE